MVGSTTTKLAKNTCVLYIRSLIIMVAALYASRVVLDALGVDDFGVYNVVGGVVVLFSFLDGAMRGACQRFLSYEIGLGKKDDVKKIFNTSITIQAIISAAMLILVEVIGLYLLFNKLVIPEGRERAAFWVFQLSTITMVINTMTIPYNAIVIAKEMMSAFAYIDVFNTLLKLGVAIAVAFFPKDRLILYAGLIALVQLLTFLSYHIYCNIKFEEAKFVFIWDTNILKEMLSFSGWIVFSSVASMLLSQGISIMYNMHYGAAINSAIGISNQVRSAVVKLSGNISMAFSPQIVMNYASGAWDKVSRIWSTGTKCTFLCFALFAVPLIIDAEYVLGLWLVEVPPYSVLFLRLILTENLVRFFTSNISDLIRATGNIKNYELMTNCINALSFIAILICFNVCDSMSAPYLVLILTSFVQVLYSSYMGCRCINYNLRKYIVSNILMVLLAFCIAVFIGFVIKPHTAGLVILFLHVMASIVILFVSEILIGFTRDDRTYLWEVFKRVLFNFFHK